MLHVEIQIDEEPAWRVRFDRSARVTFGRASSSDIVLDRSYVSRSHGEFFFEDGHWNVVDRGTVAGVVMTRPEAPATEFPLKKGRAQLLSGGEILSIGATTMRIEVKPIEENPFDDDDSATLLPGQANPLASTGIADFRSIRQHLRSDGRKLELLLDLAKDLGALSDQGEVMARISRAVFETLRDATHFAVFVPSEDEQFRAIFGATHDGRLLPLEEVAVSQSILRLAVDREAAMLFQTSDGASSLSDSILELQSVSSMTMPLSGAEGLAGVLQVDNRSTGVPFSEADLDFLVVLGSSAAFALERAQFQASLQRVFEGFVDASVTAIEARDPTTSGHSKRVAEYSVRLAEVVNRVDTGSLREYRFSEKQLTELSYAALLHDFGKVGVPECVLVKANRLFPDQLEALEIRFGLIRASARNGLLLEALESGIERVGGESVDRWIQRAMEPANARLDEILAFLREVNQAHVISADQKSRVLEIATMSFARERGEQTPYLTADEIASLCIPRGTLTEEQRKSIESHVLQSYKVLRQIPWPKHLAMVPAIVVAHHEKLDGSGYPHGVTEAEIPPQARLLSVCDIFDALTAKDRPYRAAMPLERGLDILRGDARDRKIDSVMVELFIEARVWEQRRP